MSRAPAVGALVLLRRCFRVVALRQNFFGRSDLVTCLPYSGHNRLLGVGFTGEQFVKGETNVRALRHISGGMAILFASVGLVMADPVVSADELPISNDQLPWYRSFTLRSAEVSDGAFLPLKRPDIEIRPGSQWGVTIGLEEQDPLLESVDRMSAGAFYEFSPRFRIGGGLTFAAPGELRISTPEDRILPVRPIDDEPVVRIESSIKF